LDNRETEEARLEILSSGLVPVLLSAAYFVAAIVLWNTVYLGRAIHGLCEQGQSVDENLLAHLSPLGWEHINLTGDYV
jgi:hypothetical protein